MRRPTVILIIVICLIFGSIFYFSKRNNVVSVMFINDFHGAFVANTTDSIPGAARLVAVMDSLRDSGDYPNMVVVSAGDNFGGSYFSNVSKGALIPMLFKRLGIEISAIGNHEFDNGVAFFENTWTRRLNNWQMKYVGANVLKENGTMESSPYIVTDAGSFKLAFIGLTSYNVTKQMDPSKYEGISFSSDYNKYVKQALGDINVQTANLKLLLTHIGTEMKDGKVVWMNDDKAHLLSTYPVDGVITSHSHKFVKGELNGTPILQAKSSGMCIGFFKFDVGDNNKLLDYGIIEVGMSGSKDSIMAHAVDSVLSVPEYNFKQVISKTKDGLIHNPSNLEDWSSLGSYIAASFCYAFDNAYNNGLVEGDIPYSLKNVPVIGCYNFKGIRNSLPKGDVRVLDVGEVIPFGGGLYVYNLRGRDLKKILNVSLNNDSYGWLQMNNLNVSYVVNEDTNLKVVKDVYYRKDKKVMHIEDNTNLVLVASEFIAKGGDGYKVNGESVFPESKMINLDMPGSTDAFINFLKYLNSKGVVLSENSSFRVLRVK